jgi:hypothetical protein
VIVREISSAEFLSRSNFRKKGVISSAILSPPKTPVIIPINVIPTWIEDRKLPESSSRRKAVLEPLCPSFLSCSSLDFLLETRAISDRAKNPFRRISFRELTHIDQIPY